MFRITFNNELDNKIRQLAKKPRLTDSAQSFWTELASLVEQISATPVEIGEAKYDHKNVKLRSYQVVRDFISIYYAVSDEFPFVFIEKLTLCGNHPYPLEYEEILNPMKP